MMVDPLATDNSRKQKVVRTVADVISLLEKHHCDMLHPAVLHTAGLQEFLGELSKNTLLVPHQCSKNPGKKTWT